jgi:ABC-type sugar transport system permease subunit
VASLTQARPERRGGLAALTRTAVRGSLWEAAAPYVFVAPLIATIAVFIYWPLLYSGYLSLFDWNFVSPEKTFVGAGNFTRLVAEPRFTLALRQTVVYILVLVPVQVMLPLGVALLLLPLRHSAAQGPYRVLLFAPTVVSFPVAALLWLWIFNPLQGVLNQAILAFGGSRVSWLANPTTALWCVIVVAVWKSFGFNLLLYLAALEAVPNEYVEAGEIDGATGWQLTRYVRWPLIMPTFFFVLVTTVIAVNDEVFGAISVLTDGGPFDRTTNIIYYLYQQGFRFFQIGTASAVAILVFLLTIALTWLQFRFVERRVFYG